MRAHCKKKPSLITLTLGTIIGAYLVGSISFAVVVSKLFGLPDPHSYGSHNPGATNVLRTGNKLAAVLTLVGDGLKGFVAVVVANRLGISWGDASLATAGAALAVFLGHLFPIFHRFAGGKGVSTALGIAFALSWQLGLALCVLWLIAACSRACPRLPSLTAAIGAPLLGFYFLGNWPEAWALFPIAALLIWRHRENIRKLFAGEERRIGQKGDRAPRMAAAGQRCDHRAFLAFGTGWLADLSGTAWFALMLGWLFAAILLSAFAVVRHAEALAERLGEPLGTLVLTLAVTGIEVMIIAAVMFTGKGNPRSRATRCSRS